MDSTGFLGLGFKHHASTTVYAPTSTTASSSLPTTNASNSNSATGISDALMEQYFQQCMDYHEEQVKEDKMSQSALAAGGTTNDYSTVPTAAPTFISANVLPGTNIVSIEAATSSSLSSMNASSSSADVGRNPQHELCVQTSTDDGQTDSHISAELSFQQALTKARSIAKRFASQQSTTQSTNTTIPIGTATPYYPYGQKRKEFISEIHSKRLQSHYVKNLNYLLKKDEEAHQVQVQHLQYHDQIQERLTSANHSNPKSNTIRNVSTMAGIGSKERTRVERSKERTGHIPTIRQCGVYITGLPNYTDERGCSFRTSQAEEEKESEELEGLLRQLFSSFGKVTRVTLYREKKTQLRKGDAVILYEWHATRTTTSVQSAEDDKSAINKTVRSNPEDFLRDVCNQMNGAELPCGSILSVQPADLDYKRKGSTKTESSQLSKKRRGNDDIKAGAASTITESRPTSIVSEKTENDLRTKLEGESGEKSQDEDLDDFFASLE